MVHPLLKRIELDLVVEGRKRGQSDMDDDNVSYSSLPTLRNDEVDQRKPYTLSML